MQPKGSTCTSRLRVNTLLFLAFCFIVLGAVLPVFWPSYYKTFIGNQLKMTPDSKTFQVWKSNPIPITMDFYFFNWTNRNSLEEEGQMHIPNLEERGPYRFIERIERVNVTWNDNNTITYQQAKWWSFDQENSNGSLDDEITTLNAVALTAAFTVRDWNFIGRTSLSTALGVTNQQIHVVRRVRELLFEGYSDKLINMARSMPAFSSVKVPFDKFGWFYKRNGTTFMDGVFNMNTGADDIQKMGKLEYWNYRNSTDFFAGECADVRGTTGQLFPPGQTPENKLKMFSPDLCRSVEFEYEQEAVVQGIEGYKYVGGLSMLDNGTVFPDNSCFCNGECVPSGVVNVTTCRFGAPAFASFPHFYLADSYFTDYVRGLRPEKTKHQFHIILEPTTGIPLDVAARFQINLLLQPFSGMRLYDDVPTLFFPMMWFQQRATILPSMASSLRLLLLLRYLGVILSVFIVMSGCALIVYSLILCTRISRLHMQLEKEKDEANMYVAAMAVPILDKGSPKRYIIMKPAGKVTDSAKL